MRDIKYNEFGKITGLWAYATEKLKALPLNEKVRLYAKVFRPESILIFVITGLKRSVSYILSTPCIIIQSLSKPAPVSTEGAGKLPIILPSFFSYCMKTSFQISKRVGQCGVNYTPAAHADRWKDYYA